MAVSYLVKGYLVLFIVTVCFLAISKCSARNCFCNQLVCDSDISNCSSGVTTDPCGCCQVCARGRGDVCGGEGEDAGVCGEGLACEIQAKPGDVIRGIERGTCNDIKKGCEDIACDSVVTHRCPSDSVLVYNGTIDNSECCKTTFECRCDESLCKIPRCFPGHAAFLLRKSYGKPGFCCDLYQCKVLGCRSSVGDVYKNNETWKEGDCVTCHCVDGKKRCQAEMCVKTCLNPRPVPGRCCPICDAPRQYPDQQKDSCPDLSDCNITCGTGLRKTPDGCIRCQCRPDDCYTDCPYGYKFDAYGIETCRCQTLSPECPALDHCSRKCAHGYKQSKKGCPKCRCYKCPDISDCTKSCSYGYLTNKHGCHVCKCLAHFPSKNCTVEGEEYLPGQMWSLGNCTDCVCKQDGVAVCLPVTCPVLPCQLMMKKEGLCCPVCLNFPISQLYDTEEDEPSTTTIKVSGDTVDIHKIEERYIISLCIVGAFVVMLLILVFVLLYLKLKQKHRATWSVAGQDSYCKCPLFLRQSSQIRHKYDLNGEIPNNISYDTAVVQKYQQPCVEVSLKSDTPLEEKKFIFPDSNGNNGEIDQNCVKTKTNYSYGDWSSAL